MVRAMLNGLTAFFQTKPVSSNCVKHCKC